MAITNVDDGCVSADAPPPSGRIGFPDNPILDVLKPLRVRQKAFCDAEHFFASYIENLFCAAEMLVSEKPFAAAKINQCNLPAAVQLARTLREWVISQTLAHLDDIDQGDPFFGELRVPMLVPVLACDFNTNTMLSVGEYLHRLITRHSGIGFDDVLPTLSPDTIQIGAAADPKIDGRHFLILPIPKDLLIAIQNNVLHMPDNY